MSAPLLAQEAALLDLACAGVLDDGAWDRLVAALAGCLPGGRATMTLHDPVSSRGDIALAHGFSDDFPRLYGAYFGARNPWLADVARRPVGTGERSAARLPFRSLERTEFYQDFLRPFGIRAGVGITVERQARRHVLLSVINDGRDPGREAEMAALFTRLAPHLRRALDLGRARSAYGAAARQIGLGLDACGTAALCVGAGRRLLPHDMVASGPAPVDAPARSR
jgi:hypothetical protein